MKDKKILFIALVTLLIAALGTTIIMLVRTNNRNEEMISLLELEKEEMENEYSNFAIQYEELQIRINNDSLQYKLEREKLRTQQLLEELRQVKSTNAAEITRLKKELRTVRAVLRSYVLQIDSLNRLNEALTTENKRVKAQYREATRQINTLAEEKETLNKQVTLAAQLDAKNISVTTKNKRGRKTEKVKNVTQIAIDFTIAKNITATTGERIFYIQIAKPNNEVLTKSDTPTFAYENRQLPYSIRKYAEYTGEEQTITVYWNVEEFLGAGTYQVHIFSDGTLIGSQSFTLK